MDYSLPSNDLPGDVRSQTIWVSTTGGNVDNGDSVMDNDVYDLGINSIRLDTTLEPIDQTTIW